MSGGTFGCVQMLDSEPLGLSKVMVFILISGFSIFFNTGMPTFHFPWHTEIFITGAFPQLL